MAWAAAPTTPGPVEYGEGSVAHAGQLIARGIDPYAPEPPGTFVAAIYPPISYVIAAAGERFGPFVGLRVAALAATLALAGLVAVAARRRGVLAALALGAAFLATFPVRGWAGAHRPDDVAVLFTAGAVLAAGPSWKRAAGAGLLGGLAIFTKQTAIVPLGVVLVYLVVWDRTTGRRLAITFATSIVALAGLSSLFFAPRDVLDHVIGRNATEFSIDYAFAFATLAVLAVGAFVLVAARIGSGRMRAYVIGAFAVVLLAGRAGASINFELDLAAAATLGIASAPSLRTLWIPLVLATQLIFVAAITTFGPIRGGANAIAPSPSATPALTLGAHHLAEESGVLIAAGIEPEVDELFVWSHLVALGRFPDEVTPRVRRGEFATITSSAPLDQLDAWSIQRQRWLPALAEAVLARYRLDSSAPGVYRYVPR